MKALSLTQPWATLIALGAKRIETRSWPTRYRGPLAIHAAKGFPRLAVECCGRDPFLAALVAAGIEVPTDLPRGAIIAVCRLVDCVRITPGNVPGEPERSFGGYAPGRWAWILADVQQLAEPVPAKGALGLWDWEYPVVAAR